MKNLAILILLVISLSSCDTEYTVSKEDIPIEVVELNKAGKFDTLYTIKTENYTYIWKANEYQGRYKNIDSSNWLIWFGVVAGALFVFFICSTFSGD